MLVIVTGGVVALLYIAGWAVWGVHKTYRVTIALDPQGEVEEIGDDRQIFDRDRLQAHRRRCVGYEMVLAALALLMLVGVVGSVASGDATDPLSTVLGGGFVLVVLAGLGFVPYYQARKAARQLGKPAEWWRFGM